MVMRGGVPVPMLRIHAPVAGCPCCFWVGRQ
jgi:hypothetical protein